eukprot:NODE_3026_length_952_cov_66.323636_g3006_i0.p1 GENE.NODE_3026_length_952_cov_66.323636_g3006_i0~~NODE_3026_length_952_cov_66.323636_g3006_i0.p1  ORF type:complete len:282 (-),score=51.01 NODE_3026_length_952_cov_66.323636_g3006_i0:24-869(-)
MTDAYISNILGSAPQREMEPTYQNNYQSDAYNSNAQQFDRKSGYGTLDDHRREVREREKRSVRSRLSKVLLCVVNTLFLLIGLGLIAGTVYLSRTDAQSAFAGTSSPMFAVTIGLGCGFVVFGIFGIIAACCDNRCLLGIYVLVVFILILFLLCVTTVLFVYANTDKLQTYGETVWKEEVASEPETVCTWQTQFECSGFNTACTNSTLGTEECPSCSNASDSVYPDSCWDKLQSTLKDNLMYLGIACGCAIIVVLVAVISGCCLCRRRGITREERMLYESL